MIDVTEKPKIPSKFPKRAARYNELAITPINAKFAKTINCYRLIYCMVNQHDPLAT